MKVLVTGTAGFIGSTLAKRLLARGDEVIGIDNLNDYYDVQIKKDRLAHLTCQSGFTDIRCNLEDKAAIDNVFKTHKPDRVVNLAAQAGVRYSLENPQAYIDANITGFLNILEACRHIGTEHLVYASSSSVYGSIDQGSASEDHPLQPLSPYGAAKAAMELLLGAYVERGLSVMPLRFFTVYGPRQRPDMALHRMIEATRGGPSFTVRGDGSQRRSFTFVDDVVRATVAALDSECCDPVNVGAAETVSVNDMVAEIEALTGTHVERTAVAALPGDPQRTSADSGRARSLLGWVPEVGLASGLRRQVEWQLALSPIAH